MFAKKLIGLIAVAACGAAMAIVPAIGSAATPVCAPGTSLVGNYCEPTVPTKLTFKQHRLKVGANGVAHFTVHCVGSKRCKGKVQLFANAHSTAAAVEKQTAKQAAQSTSYGSASFSIAAGKSASVAIDLSAAGKAALAQTGKLTVTVVAVTDGKRKQIGSLVLEAAKASTTHTTAQPGFTG